MRHLNSGAELGLAMKADPLPTLRNVQNADRHDRPRAHGRQHAGDIVIDGGNSHYHDDLRRAAALAVSNIAHVDVGTSGGVAGLERGYCLMIGGDNNCRANEILVRAVQQNQRLETALTIAP
jgi:3-hydroxyisobutyrate dehydrogenase-like beta-hydroxyacid dehydrogenase